MAFLVIGHRDLRGCCYRCQAFSEEEAFVRLAREAKPLWVLAALTLQSATYLMQLLRDTPDQFVGEAVNILHWRLHHR